jgi:hypothetical protein
MASLFIIVSFSVFFWRSSLPERGRSLSFETSHDGQHLLIPLDRRSEHCEKVFLDPDELPERLQGCRRRHGPLIVPSHREVTVPCHVLSRGMELRRHAPKFLRQLHIGVVFIPSVLVRDIERLLVHLQTLSHRGGKIAELCRKRGVLGETFATCRLLIHGLVHAICTPGGHMTLAILPLKSQSPFLARARTTAFMAPTLANPYHGQRQ